MKKIYVTSPSLPPLQEFTPLLESIWNSGHLTNSGEFHKSFEKLLCKYLRVKNISLFTNGTIALVTAIKALKLSGEIITTPYSFVATSHSILWNGITPVFVDIDPKTFNIDPSRIEEAITSKTTAILAVHCYGKPCDVVRIDALAKKYNLKVIYDAAHAFGVEYRGESILSYGDLSVLSFHATKVFNTFEGGAIISQSESEKLHIDRLKNFGFISETEVIETGINGKMSEFNAALGILQLKYLNQMIDKRREVDTLYRELLKGVEGVSIPRIDSACRENYSYFPIILSKPYPLSRDELYLHFNKNNIFTRKYFYPLISDFQMYQNFPSANSSNLPISKKVAEQILCLPMDSNLCKDDVHRICDLILM